MASTKVTVKWYRGSLGRAVGLSPEVGEAIKRTVETTEHNANGMGAGFRTGVWHDHATGETKGNTQPRYVADVMRGNNSYVGLVYTGNYAAYKDNLKNNTLLKALK